MNNGDQGPEVVGYRSDVIDPGDARPVVSSQSDLFQDGDYSVLQRNQIEVRYRIGSYAERAAPDVLRRVLRAREKLAGFGSEPWGSTVVVWLIEPYAGDDGEMVGTGTVVDGPRRRISFVVAPDRAVEDPHRALALVYGAALPSAARQAHLIEAYGLHVGELETSCPGEMGDDLSFVRFLIAREGDQVFRRLLAAEPDREVEVCRDLYGASLPQLRENWAQSKAADGSERVRILDFVRMSASYLQPYRLRQLELFVHMLLGLSFTLAFPLVTQRLFDQAIPSGSFAAALNLLAVLGAAFMVSLAADVRRSYLQAWIGGAVTRDLRQQLFERIQILPSRWHRKHDQGDVLTRLFTDVEEIQGGLTQVLTVGLFQILSVVVSAAVMLTINPLLGLVVLIGVPANALIFSALAGGAVDRSIEVQAKESELMSLAAENSRATNIVRLFALGGREGRQFRLRADRLFRSQQRMNTWMSLFTLSINLVVRILRLVVLGFGAWLILEGRFTLGGLVAFLSIMGEVLHPVTDIANIGGAIQGSMGSLIRVNDLLAEETEAEGAGLPEIESISSDIEFQDVSFGYGPDVRALDEVNCTIPVGSRVAFVGPSGSGKSTILRLLMRLDEPESGAILVDGLDLRAVSMKSWRRQLGVVFQDSFLFDSTIKENVGVGAPGATEADIMTAISQAELDSFVDDLPEKLDSLVGENGSGLSGGQRQRVAIARALARRPSVLVLDEATSALDPATERRLNDTLRTVGRERTVVSVTHRLGALPDYDCIFVMDRGRIVENGSHEQLLAMDGLYARLWAQQHGEVAAQPQMTECVAALGELPVFAELEVEEIEGVVSVMSQRDLKPGQRLSTQEELLVIQSGWAMVSTEPRGTAVELGPGDVVGLLAIMGSPATTTVEAKTSVEMMVLSAAELTELEGRYPQISLARAGRTHQFKPTGTLLDPLDPLDRHQPASIAPGQTVTPEIDAVGMPPSTNDVASEQSNPPRKEGDR